MYCDGCGTPLNSGARYCISCGKQLIAVPAGTGLAGVAPRATTPQMLPPPRLAAEGRVRRNINIVAGFWLANGILRLMEVGGLMIFRRLFFPSGWNWPGSSGWPFHGAFGLNPFLGGLLSAGIFLALFGGVHLVLAWGLLERQPWARILGIVIGFLALLRFPFGTALGIYTLWVFLPESSGREYDAMAGVGGPVNAARYSA
jgi:uncharacterized membrane protein (DUF2068 family)